MAAHPENVARPTAAHRTAIVDPCTDLAVAEPAPSPHELQVRKVLEVAPVSQPLAAVIAGHAFTTGRRA